MFVYLTWKPGFKNANGVVFRMNAQRKQLALDIDLISNRNDFRTKVDRYNLLLSLNLFQKKLLYGLSSDGHSVFTDKGLLRIIKSKV